MPIPKSAGSPISRSGYRLNCVRDFACGSEWFFLANIGISPGREDAGKSAKGPVCSLSGVWNLQEHSTTKPLTNPSRNQQGSNNMTTKFTQTTRMALPILLLGVTAGCATTTDFESLQKQVAELQAAASQAGKTAEEARTVAGEAKAIAGEAQATSMAALTSSDQAKAAAAEAASNTQTASQSAEHAAAEAASAAQQSAESTKKAVEALANSQMAASDAIHAKLMSYEAASRVANANAAIYSLKTQLTEEGVLPAAKEEECDEETGAEPKPEKQE
jgi:hypothetical protein